MPITVTSSRNLPGGRALVESWKRYPPGSSSATSFSQVCGFIATIRSTPPRRPSQPRSDTRTSYHVGRPWMLLGKMLRGLTGTPIRRMDFAKSVLAEAEPEPLTFANLTTESLTACGCIAGLRGEHAMGRVYSGEGRSGPEVAPVRAWTIPGASWHRPLRSGGRRDAPTAPRPAGNGPPA